MVEKKLVALGLICIVLCVAVVGAVVVVNQKDCELQMKADQISGIEDERLSLEAQVATLQSEITSLSNEKTALENHVSTLQANITSLQTEITSLENEVIESYQLGYDAGYTQGVDDAGSGWYIRDPTYAEAIAFINSDRTNENGFTDDYVCYDFTADFNTNAFQMGYRCGFVYIEFDDSAHAIACFNTTDSGLIYIEPQTDEIVDVEVGQMYLGDVIVKMGIIW
jgi:cell division protein FtsB